MTQGVRKYRPDLRQSWELGQPDIRGLPLRNSIFSCEKLPGLAIWAQFESASTHRVQSPVASPRTIHLLLHNSDSPYYFTPGGPEGTLWTRTRQRLQKQTRFINKVVQLLFSKVLSKYLLIYRSNGGDNQTPKRVEGTQKESQFYATGNEQFHARVHTEPGDVYSHLPVVTTTISITITAVIHPNPTQTTRRDGVQ
ncbi:hypothetical protein TcWFU_001324 [Taenia crassiceps]|uniref:Uncharacterized protein n=1 Tax=Taenia crassiceps TaxID=6207 RepID=A0ABR4Q492_9CEST